MYEVRRRLMAKINEAYMGEPIRRIREDLTEFEPKIIPVEGIGNKTHMLGKLTHA